MYRSLWSDHYNKISSNLRANTNSKKIRRKAKLVYAPISSEPSAIEVFFFQLPKTHSATGKSICGNLIDFNGSKITILAILHIIFKYPPNIYKLLILVLKNEWMKKRFKNQFLFISAANWLSCSPVKMGKIEFITFYQYTFLNSTLPFVYFRCKSFPYYALCLPYVLKSIFCKSNTPGFSLSCIFLHTSISMFLRVVHKNYYFSFSQKYLSLVSSI